MKKKIFRSAVAPLINILVKSVLVYCFSCKTRNVHDFFSPCCSQLSLVLHALIDLIFFWNFCNASPIKAAKIKNFNAKLRSIKARFHLSAYLPFILLIILFYLLLVPHCLSVKTQVLIFVSMWVRKFTILYTFRLTNI
jgi:hypothetical protein